MKLDSTDLYEALIHELKNDLGLLSMTLESIPLQGGTVHDDMVDAARLQCQGVVDRLQQALQIYKAVSQEIQPAIDAYSPHDVVREIHDRAVALARGRIRVEAVLAPELVYYNARETIGGDHKRAIVVHQVEQACVNLQETRSEFEDALQRFKMLVNENDAALEHRYHQLNRKYLFCKS